MFYTNLKGNLEALLFVNGDPLSLKRIAEILEVDQENVKLLLAQLIQDMNQQERGLTIIEVAGGYQLCTKPHLAGFLEKLVQIKENKLSIPALETLSIIAFKQPITKQEIEAIRGVRVDKVLANLLERNLIKELGRKEAIGRPIIYGTTEVFLKCFGLKSLEDLPELPELEEK
ncbi:MAG: SMC-Scp complex subunit ScpB [Negativicutes bacterium]|nr:SMC-Scp complex subunit ScpB [Negativicutes bacterium]MBP9536826.1 SMC-Scp complex subunit ScpB [Negativicutes bacterium]MBP9948595.1 SMC-Scp complex subunit ScpB [Negativicutes bacterium]